MVAEVINRFHVEGIPFYRVREHSTGEVYIVNARFVGGENIPPTGWSGPASVRDGNSVYVADHAVSPAF